MNFILLAVLSFPLFAQNHSGHFSAVEVEPVLVWEYVPDHGGNEWVRKGSKPIKSHQIAYTIKSSVSPSLSASKDIDTKFNPEQLMKTFFQPIKGRITHPVNSQFVNGTLSSQWLVVDPAKVNESLQNTVVVNLRELHFDETLVKIPMNLEVCVKTLGCQKISAAELKAGTVLLKEIKFKTAKKVLIYIYHWQLKDLWENTPTLHSPQAIIDN